MNSTLPPSALGPEAVVADRFHGIEARTVLQQEQPYHRHAAYLFAMGAETKEVANALGVTPHAVRDWLREPWFQQRVSKIMETHGGRDLTQLFQNEAFASLGVMLEIRDNAKVSPSVRLASCKEILDRGFGKPKVFVETTDATASSADPVAEYERIQSENKKLEEKLGKN